MKRLTAEQVIEQFRNCATAGGVVESCFLDAADIVERNLTESPDERRERFEEWCRSIGRWEFQLARSGDGYERNDVDRDWHAWNAAMDFGGWGGE